MSITMTQVNEKNCNYILSILYGRRDSIGARIDRAIANGYNTENLEMRYNDILENIDKVIEFRKSHPNCLLEGDRGYGSMI